MNGILAATTVSSAPPAGGAAIAEVIGATAGALVLTTALVALGWAHRTGRISWGEETGGYEERFDNLLVHYDGPNERVRAAVESAVAALRSAD